MGNPWSRAEPDAGEQPLSLNGLARAVVSAVEPDQSELFDEVSAAWLAGDLDDRVPMAPPGRAGTIGSGFATGALVYVVLPIVTGAVAQVLGTPARRGLRRWRLRRPRPVDLSLPVALLARAEEIRAACVEQSLNAGLSRAKADLVGEAGYAAVVRAAGADLAQSLAHREHGRGISR